ncbi:alcohol dehydrogenase family protein [Cryobacterium sp. CG_9.6]|uniref:alcohol dehydrogenase family protein n=1 Tax=Cryobacterium sp. CG_9.6 TaxID=2760710 RepID=UPI0024733C6A|nr:alcohol dehydrogenase family protein [Cryobacterium sp. CG_9.6]MDH6236428.1 NADPH:quinone reductase-like Zn-dependent oxidoreductase [Cryobacterium sp. CG_9.6]
MIQRHGSSVPLPKTATMTAVVTQGVGDFDQLVLSEVAQPAAGPGEVLVRVLAAGVNNTDINTRLGWYSSSASTATDDSADDRESGWKGATPFPLIQGSDCCGRVVAVGPGVDEGLVGARVLIRSCMPLGDGSDSHSTEWLGSDLDGAFAQFTVVRARDVFPVESAWSDAELATIPCAYGTAENMVSRAGITVGTRVLVPGASGGVGSAIVQLAKRRGAYVIGIASASKRDRVLEIGADRVLERGQDPLSQLGARSVDVVIDNVAGPGFSSMLAVLRRGGCYVTSGAIAGPLVDLDLRTLYLSDLRIIGCTAWDEHVFADVVGYVERGEIRPLLARTYPLREIATAQRDFLEKRHVGNLVLIPPA